MNGVRELLAAGAILPVGTEDAGEEAVPLTARRYRHPALDDRVVVRLVDAGLGRGEDSAAEFLGLETAKDPVTVGLGRRGSLGFPEWVLVHRPEDGHHALDIVPEMERIAQRATVKPKAALDAFQELAGRLASSVPHLLPTFYERAARAFLAAENLAYAAQMFNHARKAEVEHALPIDEERLDAVFLEFALAGALQVKAICAYGKELSHRVPADEALRRFTALCVQRTAAGLEPSLQTATELRRLAKAAGADVQAAEGDYLAEMLACPVTARAAAGWWKAHRKALVALAKERPEIRGTLLNMEPADKELPGLWMELLEESGAVAALIDPKSVLEEARPEGGSIDWLNRLVDCFWMHQGAPVPGLLSLVERMADQLKVELGVRGGKLAPPPHLDLLDLLLELGVPVEDPDPGHSLHLKRWADAEERRDLSALAADPRFLECFHYNADCLWWDETYVLHRLAVSPGGGRLLAGWMDSTARESIVPGLPGLPDALEQLGRLSGEVLALAEDAVRETVTTDLASVLVRTLRAGLFDELGWPAWEEALEELVGDGRFVDVRVADAWPYLIVSGGRQVRVIGAEGAVLVHDVQTPSPDMYADPGFSYVDGELLVHWLPVAWENDRIGYWHTAPDRCGPISGHAAESQTMYWYRRTSPLGLPMPEGGLTTGAGVLRRGDTVLPPSRYVISDGTSYWVKSEGEDEPWYEYDPANGTDGQRGMPPFLAEATRGLSDGSTLADGRMLPLASAEATPFGAPVDGVLGWRVVKLPDGSYRGEDLAGNTVTVPERRLPFHTLFLPGADEPRVLVRDEYRFELLDPDGVVTAKVDANKVAEPFAAGTELLPPVHYWHCMRPRDPRGSQALRRIDRETAASLLKTAVDGEDIAEAVRRLVPDVTHEALIAGIAGVVRFAAGQQRTLDKVARRLEDALPQERKEERQAAPPPAAPPQEKKAVDPSDKRINMAVEGLGYGKVYIRGDERAGALQALRGTARFTAAGDPEEDPLPALHLDGPELPETTVAIADMVGGIRNVAYRAVSALNPAEDREALATLLEAFGELGLIGDAERHGRWRRFVLHLDRGTVEPYGKTRTSNGNGLLAMKDSAFLVVTDHHIPYYDKFTGLFYDPSGRFELPDAYEVFSSDSASELEDALLAPRLLAEAAERGPAPWFPEAAEEFARLTGVVPAMAKLVVAGMPNVKEWERDFLPPEVRDILGLKVADAAAAKEELLALGAGVRRALVDALVPAEPSRLWTDGPDVAAAAEVWNTRVGRRVPVPEGLMAEAVKDVRIDWHHGLAMAALLDPPSAPELNRDLEWVVRSSSVSPKDEKEAGFTTRTLFGAVALTAWLAHRLPAGDLLRERLPAALAAVRDRLAHPGLMLPTGKDIHLGRLRRMTGPPTEVHDDHERYGAVVVPTGWDEEIRPAIDPKLLGETGNDPYAALLHGVSAELLAAELAVRAVRDERFAALLADPGDPAAGERAADGTWWPQDPTRSVPDLVAGAAERYGLSADAAAVYLMLLAMPDPTDRDTVRWTGWKPARLKAARAELAVTDLVVEAKRSRAGRSLFLPCGWMELPSPHVPLEEWKLSSFPLAGTAKAKAPLGVVAPTAPVADLYREAWRRATEGDGPRFVDVEIPQGRRR
ncbi:DNA-binding protein [Actinocorallia libanotica]|uniref:DNA-binding protein n=1 Tax=Actinocorallia libanotica TaxID=46162 RepID=A0ABN1Q4D9_9ACTN